MASIFTKIINGEIPCYKIAENDQFLAFLDAFPLAEGHVLVIPKQEVDYIFDMEDELYIGLQLFAKKIAKAVKLAISCTKVGVSVIGLEVSHTHIHLIPMNNVEDMNFSKPKLKIEADRMQELAESIQAKL